MQFHGAKKMFSFHNNFHLTLQNLQRHSGFAQKLQKASLGGNDKAHFSFFNREGG